MGWMVSGWVFQFVRFHDQLMWTNRVMTGHAIERDVYV